MKLSNFVVSLALAASTSHAFFVPSSTSRTTSTAAAAARRTSFLVHTKLSVAAEEQATAFFAEPASDDSESAQPAAEAERFTAFVGNLPFDASEEDVRDMFAAYGSVASINLPLNKDTNLPRGFAFVDMTTGDELSAAIAGLNNMEFMERTIKVSKSVTKEELEKERALNPRKNTQQSENNAQPELPEGCKKVYVGNLPFDVTVDELMDLFEPYGEVVELFLPRNRETGGGRGFGFLVMQSDDADRVIEELDRQDFQGRKLVVNVPLPPGERRPRGEQTERRRSSGGGNNDRRQGGSFGRGNDRGGGDRTKLYVGNLSFYTQQDTIKELFQEFGTVYDCYLPEDLSSGNGGGRGFGFVTLSNEAAEQAIEELDGCEIDGRLIRVNIAQAKTGGGGGGRGPPRRSNNNYYDDE